MRTGSHAPHGHPPAPSTPIPSASGPREAAPLFVAASVIAIGERPWLATASIAAARESAGIVPVVRRPCRSMAVYANEAIYWAPAATPKRMWLSSSFVFCMTSSTVVLPS